MTIAARLLYAPTHNRRMADEDDTISRGGKNCLIGERTIITFMSD